MKIISPAFGLMSGFGTSLGLLPHVLTLCFLLFTGVQLDSAMPLIVFTVGAKLLGEWIFWGNCISRMNSERELKNWKSVVNDSLLSQPNIIVALLTMLVDGALDAFLIYLALKTSLPMLCVFISLLGCQILSSPIQGLLSDCFSQKKSLIFAYTAGMLVMAFIYKYDLIEKPNECSTQILYVLCCKGLFANLTVIARAAIAEVIKVETLVFREQGNRKRTSLKSRGERSDAMTF